MDDLEGFWRETDRRYSLEQVPRVRTGTVTAVASPTSVSLAFPGETVGRDGVRSVSAIVPQVGQLVRVELVNDAPTVVAIIGGTPPAAPILVAADVTTSQATTGSTFMDVTTVGPAVTVTLAVGQTVRVSVYARILVTPGGAGHEASMSWAVSGASAVAAADDDAIQSQTPTWVPGARSGLYTATAAGSHTFTAKYRVTTGDTGTFYNRRIIVSG